MNRRLALSCLVFLLTLYIDNHSLLAQTRHVLFNEDFNDNRNRWQIGDRQKTKAEIDSGWFYLESKRPEAGFSRWVDQGFFYENQNFEITINLEQIKGTDSKGHALQWGGDPVNNRFHEVWIRKDGRFSISTFDLMNDREIDYVPYTYTNAIKRHAANQITIRKYADELSFFINGILVFKMPYNGIFGPAVGFYCPAAGTIKVDYVQLALLDQSSPSIFRSENASIYLVSVGIADYANDDLWQGFTDLEFTVNDAMAMRDFFQNSNVGAVPAENVSLLLNQKATKKEILTELKSQVVKSWVNDLVVFYFAGHGISTDSEPEGALSLLPYDYEIGDMTSTIHYSEIEQILDMSPSKNKMIILDACHSGGSLSKLDGDFKDLLGTINQKEIAILTSSALGETSLESGKMQRGLYSYYFMEGLTTGASQADSDKDGVLTLIELYSYTREKTAKAAAKRRHAQNPQIGGKFNPRLPLVILDSDH